MRRSTLFWLLASSIIALSGSYGNPVWGQQATPENEYHPSQIPLRFAPAYQEPLAWPALKTTADTCTGTGGQNWFNTSASQLGLTGTFTNQSFSIEGIFTVDRDLQFDNCRVKMGPNAKIEVVGNSRLTFRNTEVSACSEMWNGIYLSSSSAYIAIENTPSGSLALAKFQHATNGIVLSNGAQFKLDHAHLHNNLHHLQVKATSSTMANSIFSSQFTCDPVGIGRAPYAQSITQKAIWITDVDSIQLGASIYTAPGQPGISTISNANTGIWVENSSLELSAFELKDIENCGLLALRNAQTRKFIHTNYPTFFSNMDYGVAVLGSWGQFRTWINGCNMENIRETGIYLYKPHPEQLQCISNKLAGIEKIGIWINQMGNAWGHVYGNTFQNPISQGNFATAIYISDVAGNSNSCDITMDSNTIRHFFTGIALLNLNDLNSSHNEIYLNTTSHPTGKGTGIWAKNGSQHIFHATRIESSTPAFASNKTGLYCSEIRSLNFHNSIIQNLGDAVVLSGLSDGANIFCNRFKRYRRGVVANYIPVTGTFVEISLFTNEWIPFSGSVCETYSYYSNLSNAAIYHFPDTMPSKPLRNWVFPTGDPAYNPFYLFYPAHFNNCNYLNQPFAEAPATEVYPITQFKATAADRPTVDAAQTHEPPIHLAPHIPDHFQNIVSQPNASPEEFTVSVYPNPSLSGPTLSYNLPNDVTGSYQVYDVLGKFICKATLQSGYQSHAAIPFPVAGGTYYLRAEISDGRRILEKFVVTGE